jgi:hypothetical protein
MTSTPLTVETDADIIRVLLDACAFDELAEPDERRAVVLAAVDRGALALYATREQLAEVSDTPEPRRSMLLGLPVEMVVSTPFVLAGQLPDGRDIKHPSVLAGRYVLGANLATSEEAAIYEDVVGDNPYRNNRDAVALLTARRERLPLVTSEHTLRGKCDRHGVKVMSPQELLALLA